MAELDEILAHRNRTLLKQPDNANPQPGDSHYHDFICSVCKRVVPETETAGWNVSLYPAAVDEWAITGLVCSKKCVHGLVDQINEE